MIYILLAILLFPFTILGYEEIWTTDFPHEEGYGYLGNEVNIPTDEWSIDLRGINLRSNWYKVKNEVLEGMSFHCSYRLGANGVGVLWKSRIIELDSNKSYFVDYSLETSNNWDVDTDSNINDFVRLGYYDDNEQFISLYEKAGNTERKQISGHISNTSECQLVVEVDCTAKNEIFKLRSVKLYYDSSLGDSSDLIITKLCSPETPNYKNRYIQITNIGNHLIDLANYSLESIIRNSSPFSWELNGIILPRQSLVIGDQEASEFFCNIGKSEWSKKNKTWLGNASSNDGAQLVSNNSREIIDRVVGVNFENGFIERKQAYLLASEETNSSGWDYYPIISSAAESHPGEYIIDDTLPVSLYNTSFSWSDSGYLFTWTSYGESNLLGYNLYYAEDSNLFNALRINAQTIMAQNSVYYNNYSYSLAELEPSGYLWLEVLSLNQPNSFSQPLHFTQQFGDSPDVLEVVLVPSITLFPNPTSNSSFLKVNNYDSPIQAISIYNIKGQLVGRKIPDSSSELYNLDNITKGLSSGIYFVSTKFKTKSLTQKLILTK